MGKFIAPVEDHLIIPAMVRLTLGDEQQFALRGQQAPAPLSVRLLIDTGSKRTILIPEILDRLMPTLGARARLVTATGAAMTDLVWVRLEFPETDLAPISHVRVARHRMPPMFSQFHGLLGRDVLRQFESFEHLGRRGYYALRNTAGWLGSLRRWL